MTINSSIKTIHLGNKAFIFGGAYGNLQATQAILQKADELGFQKSEIIFTGDMVAYCANPCETVDLIKRNIDHIIMGNCEEAIAQGANNCGCGFEAGTACSVLSNQWYNFCLSKIDTKTANWMGSLPKHLNIQIGNTNFLVTHATRNSINEFVFPSNLKNQKTDNSFDGYIVGHSGIPFVGEIDNKPWVNSGAAGMPANDGTSNIWYSTISSHQDNICIETNALHYDFKLAQLAMANCGLTNGYMDCLMSGIWPSHDVLPDYEKKQTSVSLRAQKKIFETTLFKKSILA